MADGFELLTRDHQAVTGLFARFAESGEEACVREICDELAAHAALEEQAVYPTLRRLVDGGDDLADRAEQEHSAIKVLIERIELAPPEDLSDVVNEMERMTTQHVEFEETSIFPAMRESGVDAEDLGTQLEQARRGQAA